MSCIICGVTNIAPLRLATEFLTCLLILTIFVIQKYQYLELSFMLSISWEPQMPCNIISHSGNLHMMHTSMRSHDLSCSPILYRKYSSYDFLIKYRVFQKSRRINTTIPLFLAIKKQLTIINCISIKIHKLGIIRINLNTFHLNTKF